MDLARRMQDVQAPMIPVVGELIRAHPGTIALGHGVGHDGPPPQAFERAKALDGDSVHHQCQAVDGIAPLREAIAAMLDAANATRLGPDQRVVVTAGAYT